MSDAHLFQDDHDPECWRVEYMDYDGRTLFTGQYAERRTREYAEWLQTRAASAVSTQPQGRKP
jgi:hypothetical protein